MRLAIACLALCAVTASATATAQGKGGLAGGLRIDGPEVNFRSATIIVWSHSAPGVATRTLFGEESYLIHGIPEGRAGICVRSVGYHTIFDTVTIRKKSVVRREFVLVPAPPRTEPYPDCDRSSPVIYVNAVDSATHQLDSAEVFPIWEAVLRHYRGSVRMSEGDFVRMTLGVTDIPADTIGPAVVVMSLHRDVAPVPALIEWLATLTRRGLVESVCEEIDVKNCPQQEVTTYLKLAEPKRLHADTTYVAVNEIGLNPASCRLPKGGFVGLWNRSFILVRRDDRWVVVGRSSNPAVTASGFCKPEQPEE